MKALEPIQDMHASELIEAVKSSADYTKTERRAMMHAAEDAATSYADRAHRMLKVKLGGDLLQHTKPAMIRKPHPFLNPTKGWKMFARPRGTNKRRKLIPTGAGIVVGSHEFNRRTKSGGRWPKMRP